eukprot:g2643.t2
MLRISNGLFTEERLTKTVLASILILIIVASIQYQVAFFRPNSATHQSFITVRLEDTKRYVMVENAPRVALLFLSRGALHNEPVWRAFFERATELSFRDPPPNRTYVSFVETSELFKKANDLGRRLMGSHTPLDLEHCGNDESTRISNEILRLTQQAAGDERSLISKQSLFNVYTHPNQGYHFPNTSIFHGTEVKNRINTSQSWASFHLVQAEIKLLEAALIEHRNQKFVLLSESCIPIHRPDVIYLELISEPKSRLNACILSGINLDMYRYDDRMKSPFLDRSKWRKSSQWFALRRSHAELVTKENHVKQRFSKYCNPATKRCVSDEHYIPTTLAVYGLDNETDCIGKVTSSNWYQARSHPVTYGEKSVTPMLIQKLQSGESCNVARAQSSASVFFKLSSNSSSHCFLFNQSQMNYSAPIDTDDWVVKSGYKQMGYDCRLFARKFPSSVVKKTLRAALACTGGGLGAWC